MRLGYAIALSLLLSGSVQAQVQLRPIGAGPTAAEIASYQTAVGLELAGNPAIALDLLKPLLQRYPSEVRFLTVQERALHALDRDGEMLQLITHALRIDSTSSELLRLAIRVYGRAGEADSARKYATRWLPDAPVNAMPYREWAGGAAQAGDYRGMISALEEGRRAIGSDNVLSPELADARQKAGDYRGAVNEWLKAIQVGPSFRITAASRLGETPVSERDEVLSALDQHRGVDVVRLKGLLLVGWGEPLKGAELIHATLRGDELQAPIILQDLLSRLDQDEAPETIFARGRTLEWLAATQSGDTPAATRLEAARLYAQAGKDAESRRLLDQIAKGPDTPGSVLEDANLVLLNLMLDDGRAAGADSVLQRIRNLMGMEEYNAQRRRIARLWMKRGEPGRAEALTWGDSTTAGIDLIGRIRLWQGDLSGAAEALRFAGPFDAVRSLAVSRLSILALLQALGDSSSPILGRAFLDLENGDSLAAANRFDSLSVSARPEGRAVLQLASAELFLGLGLSARADSLLSLADRPEWPGTAARARYLRARILVTRGEEEAALALLEALILEFPDSAVLPDARRLRTGIRVARSERHL